MGLMQKIRQFWRWLTRPASTIHRIEVPWPQLSPPTSVPFLGTPEKVEEPEPPAGVHPRQCWFRVARTGFYHYAFERLTHDSEKGLYICAEVHPTWVENMLHWEPNDLILARKHPTKETVVFLNFGSHRPEASAVLEQLLQELKAMDSRQGQDNSDA